MVTVNGGFGRLNGSYVFTEVSRRAAAWEEQYPGERLFRLGVGDVPGPLPAAAVRAMDRAVHELGTRAGFRGYGPEGGYPFLRSAIAEHIYAPLGAALEPEEIFISDGAKSDCGGLLELFAPGILALCDPGYPAYADSALLAGWRPERLPCAEGNGFFPVPDGVEADAVWLCFPNNPTGVTADAALLERWVDWALTGHRILLFDGAYEIFARGSGLPRSIYEIPGAERCAIEVRSFSKTAGFTGVRCGYTVLPRELRAEGASLRALWARRQAARFNGVSYVTQRGAEAVCSGEGRRQAEQAAELCLETAGQMRRMLEDAGLTVYGGEYAPYLWVKTPAGLGDWECFDLLLEEARVVTTPGVGFGPGGKGWMRLTAFGDRSERLQAVRSAAAVLKGPPAQASLQP